MPKPFLRTEHNYDTDAASRESAIICDDNSLTLQSEAEDADINTIVRRFGITGQLPSNVRVPTSGDFTGIGTYHEAMNLLLDAEASFMQMPAEVRVRFNHDPQEFINFAENPDNYDEAVRLGLAVPKPALS